MTEDRKPETPGTAEVSAKFVDEAEAAAGAPPSSASVPDDPLLALRAERQGLIAELEATPEDEDAAFWPRLKDVEKRILTAEPQTLLGALTQIEVLASMADEGLPEFAMGIIAGMNEQIPARIERLLAASLGEARAIEDPVLALKREWEARWEQYLSVTDRDDHEAIDPLHAAVNETEYEIFQTPATTLAGIAFKLVLWARQHVDCSMPEDADWSRPPVTAYSRDLDELPVVSALHDLERMAGEGVVTRTAATVVAMTDEPVHDALNGLADSLAMVDSARHALGTVLEDMSGQPGENIGFCILRTLDAAAKQGEASFDIVWKAMKGKAA